MSSEEILPDHTLLVHAGRIVALGPAGEIEIPKDALRIDGTGKFLMPGLADMHVHVWNEEDLFLFVANGVTTVRNMFGDPLHLGWRERIEQRELVGPRIYTAGPIIDGQNPVWPGSVELTDPTEAPAVLNEQKEAGYDFGKPYSRLSADCYESLAAASKDSAFPLMGHVPGVLTIHDVLAAGQHTIEHLDGWAEAVQAGSSIGAIDYLSELSAWQTIDDEKVKTLAQEMAKQGAWNCPTLVVQRKWVSGAAAEEILARPEMRYVSAQTKAYWSPTSPLNYLSRMPENLLSAARDSHGPKLRTVRALRDAGAGILLGTDMGNPYVTAGFSLHEELSYFVEAGLSPYEALKAGTIDAARCMGAESQWGSLAVGQRADLLLLGANPLTDVRHTAQRVGVVLNGRWLPESELAVELERRAKAYEAR